MKAYRLSAVLAVSLVRVASAADPATQPGHDVGKRWHKRVKEGLLPLNEDARPYAATSAVISLGEAGDAKSAYALIEELLPDEGNRDQALVCLAGALAERGQVKDALAAPAKASREYARQMVYAFIARGLAKRGEVNKARKLLPGLSISRHRDTALSAIAKAQARAGDATEARKMAEQIKDDDRRRNAVKAVNSAQPGKGDPADHIRSETLRSSVRMMRLFAGKAPVDEAMKALAAAQRRDGAALETHCRAALELAAATDAMTQTAAQTVLAVALLEAGRTADAKAVLRAAGQASGDEALGVASLTAGPALVYLLVRLDMDDVLDEALESLTHNADGRAPVVRGSLMQAVGASYAELKQLHKAEALYAGLNSRSQRLHLAVGVMRGLAARPTTSRPAR